MDFDNSGQQRKWGDHLLFHFHPLKNIQTFIYSFAREINITYFKSLRLHLPGCYSMRFTALLNYYLTDWCDADFRLSVCWLDFRFCYSHLTWETGRLELESTIILVLKANWLTKCASHPWLTKCASHLWLTKCDSQYFKEWTKKYIVYTKIWCFK